MRVYSYCSYRNSHCGFRIGSFDYHDDNLHDRKYFLEKKAVNKYIQTAFENGYSDFVFGNVFNTDKYFIIIKGFEAKPEEIYMNFAFEFSMNEKKEYLKILSGILCIYDNISDFVRYLKNFVVIDKNNAGFGLEINSDALDKFLLYIKNLNSENISDFQADGKVFFFRKLLQNRGNKDYSKEIHETFEFDSDIEVKKFPEYYEACRKEKNNSKFSAHSEKLRDFISKIKEKFDD